MMTFVRVFGVEVNTLLQRHIVPLITTPMSPTYWPLIKHKEAGHRGCRHRFPSAHSPLPNMGDIAVVAVGQCGNQMAGQLASLASKE